MKKLSWKYLGYQQMDNNMKRVGIDVKKKRWSGTEAWGFHRITRMAKRDQQRRHSKGRVSEVI